MTVGTSVRRKRRLLSIPLLVVLAVIGGLLLWQALAFPRTGTLRALIRSGERVEVRAYFIHNEARGVDFLVLTDPVECAALADSFRIVGLWLPFDELIANTYRIRVIRGGESTDIILRGGTRVQHGGLWHAPIGDGLHNTIQQLVARHGGAMPDWQALRPSRPPQ